MCCVFSVDFCFFCCVYVFSAVFMFFCCFFLFFPDVLHSYGVLDRCFLIGVFMCVCFQECFDIDLIGDLLCDFDW